MAKKTTGKEPKSSTEKFIKEIRRNTAKAYSSEQKILIVMEGMRAISSKKPSKNING